MLELILKEPIEKLIPKLIEFNSTELVEELKPKLEVYKNTVYSEEQIPTAKSDRATLNKFKESIDNERKRIKKVYLEPYEKFEKELKEVTSLIDESSQAIDTQIKAFEVDQKEKKKQTINNFWFSQVGDLKDLLTLEKIFNDKWLNATYKMNDIQSEIKDVIDRVSKDLEVIKLLKSKHEIQLQDFYLKTLDMSLTLQEKSRLEESEKRLTELAQKQAQEDSKHQEQVINLPTGQNDLEQVDFRVWVTNEQKQLLKQFLIDNKIKYGKVKEN